MSITSTIKKKRRNYLLNSERWASSTTMNQPLAAFLEQPVPWISTRLVVNRMKWTGWKHLAMISVFQRRIHLAPPPSMLSGGWWWWWCGWKLFLATKPGQWSASLRESNLAGLLVVKKAPQFSAPNPAALPLPFPFFFLMKLKSATGATGRSDVLSDHGWFWWRIQRSTRWLPPF